MAVDKLIDLSLRGPAGDAGISVRSSPQPRNPTYKDGQEGDFWINQSTTMLWRKTYGVWKPLLRLRGRDGLPGPRGPGFYSGEGEPTALIGNRADLYLDRLTGDIWGPKSNSYQWPLTPFMNVLGPEGAEGPQGDPGPQGNPGVQGPLPFAWPPITWTTGMSIAGVAPVNVTVQNGNMYGATSNHTAGASFAGDLASGKWVLIAAKGTDGAGAGDVTSPAGTYVAGHAAVFTDTSGNEIADGGALPTEASASDIWTSTSTTKFVSPAKLLAAMARQNSTGNGSWAPDFNTGINFGRTLNGNSTLANPTNAKIGWSGDIRFTQDATGGRTLAFGSAWHFADGAPTAQTAAAAVDCVYYEVITVSPLLIEATFKAL